MTAQTSRYGLTYPTGSDLVSGAPAQFKQLAESVESALGEVDDRHTENAVVPVVRETKGQLDSASGVTGQTGYVTGDGGNKGVYVYDGSGWVRPNGPVTLWTGSSGKTDTLTLSLPATAFTALLVDVECAEDAGGKTYVFSPDIGDILMSFVSISLSSGTPVIGSAKGSINGSTLSITGQRYANVGGSTTDRQALSIKKIRGII